MKTHTPRHRLTASLPLMFLLLLSSALYSQSVSSAVDWEEGVIRMEITQAAAPDAYNRPASLFKAERNVDREIRDIMLGALMSLQADSANSLKDLVRSDRQLLRTLETISAGARQTFVRPEPGLDSVVVGYELDIFPTLSSVLVRHNNAFPMEEVLGWQPGSDFTGIVIYAARPLPVHGEGGSLSHIQPAIFPVIYDDNLRLLVNRNRMDPEYASRWGTAVYSSDFSEREHVERIGTNPYRIIATGLFGIVPADLKIPRADADVLLHSENGRRLLREGRILIIGPSR